jgi:hypothetical protein
VPWPVLQFCNLIYTDGRTPWMSDQPFARSLPTHRTTQTQNKRTCRHPCFEWDSNPRSQHSNDRRHFTPQTARPPWSAIFATLLVNKNCMKVLRNTVCADLREKISVFTHIQHRQHLSHVQCPSVAKADVDMQQRRNHLPSTRKTQFKQQFTFYFEKRNLYTKRPRQCPSGVL